MWNLTELMSAYHHPRYSYIRRERKENIKDYFKILKLFNQKSNEVIHGNKGNGKKDQLCYCGFGHVEFEMIMVCSNKDAWKTIQNMDLETEGF